MTVLTNAQLETVVAPQLERLGFRRRRGGVYGLDQLELRCADHWLTIECEDAPTVPLGSPATSGLWREVRDRGGTRRRVFDLPVEAFLNEPDDEISETLDDNLPLTACLRWALVAPRGGLGARDTLPALDLIDSHLQGHTTTVRAGDIVRECVVERDSNRLMISCPLVLAVPQDLAPARREWLTRLIISTQDVWRMVKVMQRGSAVLVAVDLTGAPPAALPGLLHASLESVRGSVAWAARAAALIVSDAESLILDGPVPGRSGRRPECVS